MFSPLSRRAFHFPWLIALTTLFAQSKAGRQNQAATKAAHRNDRPAGSDTVMETKIRISRL